MLSFREKASKNYTNFFKQLPRVIKIYFKFIDYITINVSEFF